MVEQLKILVCGDVDGNITKLYSRVNNVMKKSTSFDYLFCVGNFFGKSDQELLPYKNGEAKVPIPTYILGPNNTESLKFYPELSGCDVAPNITYLGKRGVFSTDSGLIIAYVSGVEDTDVDVACQVTEEDLSRVHNACRKGQSSCFRGIDILLTSCWPADVTKYDENSILNAPKGSHIISKLALSVKPRYHFFGLEETYYERHPYKNADTGFGCHFTRAIALSSVTNKKKEKWLFAMNVIPFKYIKESELNMMTTDTTECPYSYAEGERAQQFFYDMNHHDRILKRKARHHDGQQRQAKIMNISQDDCWFCLASPKFEKHLVVSIGDEAYLTLAKGGLVWDHAMILPISHYKNFPDMSPSLCEEIKQFKMSLVKYYASQKKVPVFFDRNFRTPHYQIQAIPVPANFVEKVYQLFMTLSEGRNCALTDVPENAAMEDILGSQDNYFYVEVGRYRMIHSIRKFFPLQFAREVLALPEMLDLPERVQWKDCESSKEDEDDIAQQFRNGYKRFDFTLEEDMNN